MKKQEIQDEVKLIISRNEGQVLFFTENLNLINKLLSKK